MSLAYYKNPFTRNSAQPKIADGKFDNSIGLSRRASKVIKTPDAEGSDFNHPLYICVIPGILNQFAVYNTAGTPSAPTAEFNIPFNDKWDHLWNLEQLPTSVKVNNAPLLWRMVSSGLRVVPVSSDADSEGFLETFTIPISKKRDQWVVRGTTVIPTTSYIAEIEKDIERMRDNSSYWTGSYREVENFQYANTVNDPDHKPIEISEQYVLKSAGGVEFETATELQQDMPDASNLLDEMFDSNFNMRIIRIQAKPGEKFLLTLQSNFELHFGIGNPIRAFQTENRATVASVAAANTARAVAVDSNGVTASTNAMVTPSSARGDTRDFKRASAQVPKNLFKRMKTNI